MSFNIYNRRRELGLTLEEIGKVVGVSKSTVKKWESGYIKNMKRDKIILLAKVLEVSPMEILFSNRQNSSVLRQKSVRLSDKIALAYQDFVSNVFGEKPPQTSLILCSKNELTFLKLSDTGTKAIEEILPQLI